MVRAPNKSEIAASSMIYNKVIDPFLEWRIQLQSFLHLKLINYYDISKICGIMIVLTFFEAASVATFIPVLEYLQAGNLQEIGSNPSKIWLLYQMIFDKFGLSINILTLSVSIVIFVTLRQTLNYISTVKINTLKHRIGRDLAIKCFSGIFNSKPLYIQNFQSGSFVNTIDNQCQYAALIIRALATLFGILITFTAYFMVMIITAPYASIMAISIMGIIILSVERWVKIGLKLSKELVNYREKYIGFLGDRYRNWRAIKTSGTEKTEVILARNYANKHYNYGINITKNSGKNILIVSPVMTTFALLTLYLSVEYLDLTISTIAVFILILVRLVPVTQNLANQRQMVASAQPSFNHIKKVLDESKKNVEKLYEGKEFDFNFKNININNISFKYPNTKDYAVKNLTCNIPANKKTAIIGRSGSGKSTLSDLVSSLYKPDSGNISFDKINADIFSLNSRRKRIAYVSQQPLIFAASILDNVSYVRPNVSQEEVIKACKEANAHDFIQKLPNGYNEILIESGVNLSGGERQRIMLARAFLMSTDIIILDEATSSVDFESETKIMNAVNTMSAKKNITIIIIAHRVSTIKNVDHLIILNKGELISQGSPKTLKYDQNWYKSMLESDEDI